MSTGDFYTTSNDQTWYTYSDASGSTAGTVYVNPEQHTHSYPKAGNWEWYNDSGDGEVYINGVPVNRRIEELQDVVKLMTKMLFSHANFSRIEKKNLKKLVKKLTMKEVDGFDEPEKQKEEPLDEKLFEI